MTLTKMSFNEMYQTGANLIWVMWHELPCDLFAKILKLLKFAYHEYA